MLSQLVYVSNRKESCTSEEIDNILTTSIKNNPILGITGVLLYSDVKFIQLFEGQSGYIRSLYEKIKQDSRHKNCVLIYYVPIIERTFPNWHMGSKRINGEHIDFVTNVNQEDKHLFERILAGKEGDSDVVLNTIKKFFN